MTDEQGQTATLVRDLCRRTLQLEGRAIRFEGEWMAWEVVRGIADEVARALDGGGVAPDAPVAFVPRNRPSSLAAFLPLLAQQRCVRMVYPFQSPEALSASLAKLEIAAVVMDQQDFSAPVTASLREVGVAGIGLGKTHARLVEGLDESRATVPAQGPRLEILTSGTTGPPKHFPIGYDVVLGYIRQAEAAGRGALPPAMLCFPLSNISGLYTLAASFLRGEPTVLLERFTVAGWRDYIVEFRPASGGAPPAALAMILDQGIAREDLASLRFFTTGAAPLDPEVQRRFEERYGIPVLQTYGATEFGGPVTAMTPDLRRDFGDGKAGSVGRPFGGAQIRIRDVESGAMAGPGSVGIVEVVSPRMGQDWIATSDLGLLDDDGFLFLRGRADGAIMRGGFKIVPELVEEVILKHPSVAAVSVVGLPDDRLLEVPVAAIELAEGSDAPDEAQLEQHVRAHLPATHVPVRWRMVSDLPRTVSFKVDRAAVRALFAKDNASLDR